MNLIPWRQRASAPLARFHKDIDELWSRFQDDSADGWFTSHLPEVFTQGTVPSVNISENEKVVTVSVDLPGVDAEDVDVEVMGDELVISGERKWENKEEEKELVRMESQFGSFRRVIPLPSGLRTDPKDIDAKYKKGILKIRLTKVAPTPSKKITVKAS